MYAELTKRARGNRSIRQFAKESNLSASYITGIESGKYKPSLQVLVKICNASQGRVVLSDFVGTDISSKAEKLYRFCMHVLKDEDKEVIRMYYSELSR